MKRLAKVHSLKKALHIATIIFTERQTSNRCCPLASSQGSFSRICKETSTDKHLSPARLHRRELSRQREVSHLLDVLFDVVNRSDLAQIPHHVDE